MTPSEVSWPLTSVTRPSSQPMRLFSASTEPEPGSRPIITISASGPPKADQLVSAPVKISSSSSRVRLSTGLSGET